MSFVVVMFLVYLCEAALMARLLVLLVGITNTPANRKFCVDYEIEMTFDATPAIAQRANLVESYNIQTLTWERATIVVRERDRGKSILFFESG